MLKKDYLNKLFLRESNYQSEKLEASSSNNFKKSLFSDTEILGEMYKFKITFNNFFLKHISTTILQSYEKSEEN